MSRGFERPLRRALWLLPLAMSFASPGAGQAVEALLERASVRYGALESLCADFEQTLHVPLLAQTTESRGRLCQRAPNFFRMDFTDPAGDQIVADGERLWIYYPSTQPGQVVQTDLANGGAIDFHREFLSDPTTRYDLTPLGREDVGGLETERIKLVPRSPTSYLGATVWIDREQALIRRIEIEQEGGSLRVIEMSNLGLDPDIASGFFRFDVPAGVQVVRMDLP